MAHNHDKARGLERSSRGEDVRAHGQAADGMKHFWQRRLHARALPCGKHNHPEAVRTQSDCPCMSPQQSCRELMVGIEVGLGGSRSVRIADASDIQHQC